MKLVPPPWNVPLAPLDGAVKVTDTPATGWPPLSVTVTAKVFPNPPPVGADWGVVLEFAVMFSAGAGLVFSRIARVPTL